MALADDQVAGHVGSTPGSDATSSHGRGTRRPDRRSGSGSSRPGSVPRSGGTAWRAISNALGARAGCRGVRAQVLDLDRQVVRLAHPQAGARPLREGRSKTMAPAGGQAAGHWHSVRRARNARSRSRPASWPARGQPGRSYPAVATRSRRADKQEVNEAFPGDEPDLAHLRGHVLPVADAACLAIATFRGFRIATRRSP